MRGESSASEGRNHLDQDGNRQAHVSKLALVNCRIATIMDTEHNDLPPYLLYCLGHFHRPFFKS